MLPEIALSTETPSFQALLSGLCSKLSCEWGWQELCLLHLMNGIFRVSHYGH